MRHSILSIIIILCISGVAHGAEICVWIDGNRQKLVSHAPPPEGMEIVECKGYQPTLPEEGRAFNRKQKLLASRSELEGSLNRPYHDQGKAEWPVRELKKNAEINQAREELKKLLDRRDRYRDYQRDSRTQRGSNFWVSRIKYHDRQIEKTRERLRGLDTNK
jgi:hypothetical protein